MKYVSLIIVLMLSTPAWSGVLDRIKLEDAVQARLEKGLREYDPHVRVELSFTFKKSEILPGTTLATSEDLQPAMVEEADITRINILVISASGKMSNEMVEALYRLIPVRKTRIKVTEQKLQTLPPEPAAPVAAKDLKQITYDFADLLSKTIVAAFVISLAILTFLALYINHRTLKKSRESFDLIAKSISEFSSYGLGSSPSTFESKDLRTSLADTHANPVNASVAALPSNSLKELFADCYWCQFDGYAHWLWKQIHPEQKQKLLSELPFMKDYSMYFVETKAVQADDHDHPYYLAPEAWALVSQEVLQKEVIKNPGLWNALSPLRQKTIDVPLFDKLKLVQGPKIDTSRLQFKVTSLNRKLDPFIHADFVSFEDEKAIFENPEMVPMSLRKQVRSLVWLSLLPQEKVAEILSRYDARSLASAWLAEPQILEILEMALPDKKRKIVKDYAAKMSPRRDSEVFQSLVDEAFVNDKAA